MDERASIPEVPARSFFMSRGKMTETSRHHIWFPRRQWGGGARKQLRDHPGSIVRLTQEGHERLHRNLQSHEHLFRPHISVVIGMLAVADCYQDDGGLDDVLERIERWREVCRPQDSSIDYILKQQAKFIERGWPKPPIPEWTGYLQVRFCQECYNVLNYCECPR